MSTHIHFTEACVRILTATLDNIPDIARYVHRLPRRTRFRTSTQGAVLGAHRGLPVVTDDALDTGDHTADRRWALRQLLRASLKGAVLAHDISTIAQARELDSILRQLGSHLMGLVVLDVPEDTLLQRLADRSVCTRCFRGFEEPPHNLCPACGVPIATGRGSAAAAYRNRLRKARADQPEIIVHYGGFGPFQLRVDGTGTVNEVAARIRTGLAPVR